MKSKLLSSVTLAAVLCAAGCASNPALTTSVVRTLTGDAVTVGLIKYPQVRPELTAARVVICAAANGTNASPEAVAQALGTLGTNSVATTLILNNILSLLNLAYESTGTNSAKFQPFVEGACLGLGDGLGLAMARKIKYMAAHHLPPYL